MSTRSERPLKSQSSAGADPVALAVGQVDVHRDGPPVLGQDHVDKAIRWWGSGSIRQISVAKAGLN